MDFGARAHPFLHSTPPSFPPLPNTIYLDFAAATPIDPQVLEAVAYWSAHSYGNPSSLHPMGSHGALGVQWAREQVAQALHCSPLDIVFTASATEAANLALRGLVAQPKRRRHRLLFGATEHSCITNTLEAISAQYGTSCHPLPVDAQGQILPEALSAIDETVLAVAVMPINNETGVIQTALPQVIQRCREVGALVVLDGVQALARSPEGFSPWVDYDLAFVSSAKIYGPRGVGALAIRPRKPKIRLVPHTTGGGHEGGLRGGSLNVPGIVGFGLAVQKLEHNRQQHLKHYQACEEAFFETLKNECPEMIFHGNGAPKAPGLAMLALPGVNAMALKDSCTAVCFSTGSACRSLQASASPVLTAMGVSLETALASFRVSFGAPSTVKEAAQAALAIAQTAQTLKSQSATWV